MSNINRRLIVSAFAHDQEMISEISYYALRVLPMIKRQLFGLENSSRCDLPMSHVSILVMLDRCEAMSLSAIGECFGIARPNITPIIDRLIEHGYVMRKRDDRDRRVTNIVIMPPGRDVVAQILRKQADSVGRQIAHMKSSQVEELLVSLKRVSELLG